MHCWWSLTRAKELHGASVVFCGKSGFTHYHWEGSGCLGGVMSAVDMQPLVKWPHPKHLPNRQSSFLVDRSFQILLNGQHGRRVSKLAFTGLWEASCATKLRSAYRVLIVQLPRDRILVQSSVQWCSPRPYRHARSHKFYFQVGIQLYRPRDEIKHCEEN